MIPPLHYVSEAHHKLEQECLFGRTWIFAGMASELDSLSHRCVEIAGISIILQIDKSNKPRAYLNVCSHRHTQLCEPGLHKSPVRCPYHGWVYDREGLPVGIPIKEAFPQVHRSPEEYRLKEFNCEAAGAFIFIRIISTGISLHEYLGSQYEFLAHASISMKDMTDEFIKVIDANWKIVIENSLEGYHVPAVHSQTFMQIDGMDTSQSAPKFFFDSGPHSYLEHALNADWATRFARIEKKIGHWPWRFEHYTHRHIFPNLTITSFMGYSFHVQVFQPTSCNKTTVHSRTIGVDFKDSTPVGTKMVEKIYADGHEFTNRVFAEDASICAKVHTGLCNASRLAVLGAGIEDRVKHFQSSYLLWIKK